MHWALDFFLWSEIDVADSPMDYIISAVMRIAGFVGTSIFLARIVFLVQQFVDARLSNLQEMGMGGMGDGGYTWLHHVSNNVGGVLKRGYPQIIHFPYSLGYLWEPPNEEYG